MDNEFRAFLEMPDEQPVKRLGRKHYNPFNWAVFLILLTGFALASWIGSYYVMQHPEDPRCYKILQAMNKADPLKRFEVTAAPPGRFYTAKDLYDSYLNTSQPEIDQKNSALLRDYLRNYADTRTLVPYVAGHFKALGVYELKASDMFPTGVVAVAESVDCPEVMIEHVYTTEAANIPKVRRMLAVNPDIVLEKTFDLSAIVHAEKMEDGKFLFTVMPLGYGNYAFRQGISSTFRLDPPRTVNLDAGMPLIKPDSMQKAIQMFAQYRKTRGMLAEIKAPVFPDPMSQTVSRSSGPAITPPPADESIDIPESSIVQATPAPVPAEVVAESTPAPTPDAVTSATPASTPSTVESTVPVEQPAVENASAPGNSVAQGSSAVAQSPAASSEPAAQPQVVINPVLPGAPLVVPIAQSRPVVKPSPVQKTAAAQPQPRQQKVVAKASPALKAPTPVVATRLVAHGAPTPTLAQVIAALHNPIPKVKSSTSPDALPSPARSVAVATPFPVARAVAVTTPQPQPAQEGDESQQSSTYRGVKFEPFMAGKIQQQSAAQSTAESGWRTYQPGQMPRGKLLDWQNAPELAEIGVNNERYYIRGKYVVTASSQNRVVLRPQGAGGETIATMRLVVEFPKGAQMPAEGSQVARGEMRPFEIVDVRRGDDGQVNVYAREVTAPWQLTNNADVLRSYYLRERLANQYTQ